jgi:hypothetical protein
MSEEKERIQFFARIGVRLRPVPRDGVAALRFFCAAWAGLSIEVPKGDVPNAISSAVQQAIRRVKT